MVSSDVCGWGAPGGQCRQRTPHHAGSSLGQGCYREEEREPGTSVPGSERGGGAAGVEKEDPGPPRVRPVTCPSFPFLPCRREDPPHGGIGDFNAVMYVRHLEQRLAVLRLCPSAWELFSRCSIRGSTPSSLLLLPSLPQASCDASVGLLSPLDLAVPAFRSLCAL